MERLTERSKTGTAFFDDDGALIRGTGGAFHQKKDMTADFIHQRFVALDKTIDRLAAYEDTMPLERAQELSLAEKDGRLVVLPFVEMVERSLQNGKMTPNQDQRFNGRYAVVYADKKKWASPLIDICGRHYDREEAEKRLAELTREEAEAALKKREEADNEAD